MSSGLMLRYSEEGVEAPLPEPWLVSRVGMVSLVTAGMFGVYIDRWTTLVILTGVELAE